MGVGVEFTAEFCGCLLIVGKTGSTELEELGVTLEF